ncbi:MAG: hypothetical protein ACLQGP_02175 [Isosphaeraceae bacterium]
MVVAEVGIRLAEGFVVDGEAGVLIPIWGLVVDGEAGVLLAV